MNNLYIIGDIDHDKFQDFCEELEELLKESAKYHKGKPIHITLTSDGGNADVAIAFAEMIRSLPNEVTILAVGHVASAAVLILAAGDHRKITKNTTVMVHEEQLEEPTGSVSALEKTAADARKRETSWNNMLAEFTKISAYKWAELHKQTTYLNADECFHVGLVDEIV